MDRWSSEAEAWLTAAVAASASSRSAQQTETSGLGHGVRAPLVMTLRITPLPLADSQDPVTTRQLSGVPFPPIDHA